MRKGLFALAVVAALSLVAPAVGQFDGSGTITTVGSAQYSNTLPVTCGTNGCSRATAIVNPDGSFVGSSMINSQTTSGTISANGQSITLNVGNAAGGLLTVSGTFTVP